ncbi:MAG: LPS export ABC transporter periplasmic protein LptC [Candidatus Cloacimonetes bacterium]|nr:LPS export ABC transporter periplasmic protein LptC [Candidatus Cloacimonadota bacterium]
MTRLSCVIWKASISLLMAVMLLSSCQKTDLQPKTAVLERGLPDETSYNVKITQYIENRFEYELQAARIERFQSRKMIYGYSVTLTTFDKLNKVNSVITADSTIIDDARNIIQARGKVKMTSPNGDLATSEISWDRAVDEIVAPQNVKLTRDGSVLYGKNLHTNSKLSLAMMDEVSAEGIINEKDFNW